MLISILLMSRFKGLYVAQLSLEMLCFHDKIPEQVLKR